MGTSTKYYVQIVLEEVIFNKDGIKVVTHTSPLDECTFGTEDWEVASSRYDTAVLAAEMVKKHKREITPLVWRILKKLEHLSSVQRLRAWEILDLLKAGRRIYSPAPGRRRS